MSNQIAEVPRYITPKDRQATNREVELEQRKRKHWRYVSKVLSLQRWANQILRQNRTKLQKTPQLTFYPTTASHSVHASNIRGRGHYR